jgi:hypothetical protein
MVCQKCRRGGDLGEEVVDAVDGQVEGGEAAGQETPPPPVIVLTTSIFTVSAR